MTRTVDEFALEIWKAVIKPSNGLAHPMVLWPDPTPDAIAILRPYVKKIALAASLGKPKEQKVKRHRHAKDDIANFKHGPECSGCAYDCNGGRWVPVR